jgi:hypothetical protein
VKRRLFKNLGWKVGGLLLALALWFHLTTEQQFNKQMTVNIDYINISDELILSPNSQKSAIIEITANGKELFKILYFDSVKLVIDLSAYNEPGNFSLKLSRDQLTIPASMTGVKTGFVGLKNCDFELIRQQS